MCKLWHSVSPYQVTAVVSSYLGLWSVTHAMFGVLTEVEWEERVMVCGVDCSSCFRVPRSRIDASTCEHLCALRM